MRDCILDDLQREVGQWGKETFPLSDGRSIHAHLLKEAKELQDACERWMECQAPVDVDVAWPSVLEEVADIVLITMHIAHRRKFSLYDVIRAKFLEVQTREWGEPDDDGVVEHVRVLPAECGE